MRKERRLRAGGALLLALLIGVSSESWAASHHFRIRLDPAIAAPVSGRLLVFATPIADAKAQAKDGRVSAVDTNTLDPMRVSVAAMDIDHLQPGTSIDIDTDAIAFPVGFSKLAAGEYAVQAVLDVNRNYNYGGRGAGDVVSEVAQVRLGENMLSEAMLGESRAPPALSLVRVLPGEPDPSWELPQDAPQDMRDDAAQARRHAERLDFVSPALTAFWGRPIRIRGWVLLPPDYAAKPDERYPTVYYTHGFTGRLATLIADVATVDKRMRNGQMPPMIWVILDQSTAAGTHEFADSVNNGPWGTALTGELIPDLEKRYRMDGEAGGRFLNGHSSGGWAALWLQVAYPKLFGGAWATSPDPSDFRDFFGIDLYAKDANVYRKPDGSPRPLVRENGEVQATFEQYAKLERVFGPYGGQMASFEWVFSPRGADGRPLPMFDRDSGRVDPAVAAYWREHYDIAERLRKRWPELKPDLDGKIHLVVGDADSFYADGAAHRLKARLDGLDAKSNVRFVAGRDHFDLFVEGTDRRALLSRMAWEMYAVARPGAAGPKVPAKP